jgi:superfamily I DNA/RNA helicase
VGWQSDSTADDGSYLRFQRLLAKARADFTASSDNGTIRRLADMLLGEVGMPALASLSAEYQAGARLQDVIEKVLVHLESMAKETGDVRRALHEFTGRSAVKIMTIHKSKSLEFDRVVILGVEGQALLGRIDDARALFFVGISRARHHLCLTHCRLRPDSGARAVEIKPHSPPSAWRTKSSRPSSSRGSTATDGMRMPS